MWEINLRYLETKGLSETFCLWEEVGRGWEGSFPLEVSGGGVELGLPGGGDAPLKWGALGWGGVWAKEEWRR